MASEALRERNVRCGLRALNEASEGLPGVLSQGWEVAEADGMEVKGEKLLQRAHRRVGASVTPGAGG